MYNFHFTEAQILKYGPMHRKLTDLTPKNYVDR